MEGQRIRQHLTSAADGWDTLGRPDSELYRGVRLTQALQWRERADTRLTATEIAFLDASERTEQSERRAEQVRARAQARLIRRLRVVLAVAVVLLVVALSAGLMAFQQQDRAEDNAAAATAAETSAEARRAGASALITDDLDESMLLAVAGVRLDDSPETRSSLLSALGRHPEADRVHRAVRARRCSPSTSARTEHASRRTTAPTGSGCTTSTTGARLARVPGGRSGPARLGSPARCGSAPTARSSPSTMAAPTRDPVALLDATYPGAAADAARRDRVVALAGQRDRLQPRRAPAGARSCGGCSGHGDTTRTPTRHLGLRLGPGRPRPPGRHACGCDSDGVSARPDGTRRRFFTTPAPDPPRPGHRPVGRSCPSPGARSRRDRRDEPHRAGAGGVRRGRRGRRARPADGPRAPPDADGGGRPALLPELLRRRTPDGHGGVQPRARPSSGRSRRGEAAGRVPLGDGRGVLRPRRDGSTLYTAGSDGALRHWDVDGDRRFVSQVAYAPLKLADLYFVRPSPDGRFLAYPTGDDVAFFDVTTGQVAATVTQGSGYRRRANAQWHPDGVHFAAATDGEIRVWDARTGRLVARARPAGGSSRPSTTAPTAVGWSSASCRGR